VLVVRRDDVLSLIKDPTMKRRRSMVRRSRVVSRSGVVRRRRM
jgi:hypothetical protein